MSRVDLQPIREAFERSEYGRRYGGVGYVARSMGMDAEYVRRLLGRKLDARTVTYKDGTTARKPYRLLTCTEETALKFATVLDLDPVDLGF